MAKLLKHFGLGGKKSVPASSRPDFTNSTAQKSNSVNELGSCKYQSSNARCSAGNSANVSKASPDYDTRSLKLNLDEINKCSGNSNKSNNKNDSNNNNSNNNNSDVVNGQNVKLQYLSLQKNSSPKSDVPGGGSSATVENNQQQNQQQQQKESKQQQQQTTKQCQQSDDVVGDVDKPDILEEYCDPHDLTKDEVEASAPTDDDYSTPYDEVAKVLKDLKAYKSNEALQNGVQSTTMTTTTNNNNNNNNNDGSSSTKDAENSNVTDKEGTAKDTTTISATTTAPKNTKVPLKLTSPSTITTIHIKQKRPKTNDANPKTNNDVNSKSKIPDSKDTKVSGVASSPDPDISNSSANTNNPPHCIVPSGIESKNHDHDGNNVIDKGSNVKSVITKSDDKEEDDDEKEGEFDDNDDEEEEEEKELTDEIKNHEYTVFVNNLESESIYDKVNKQEIDDSHRYSIAKDTKSQETINHRNAQDNNNHYSSLTMLSCKDFIPTNQNSDDLIIASDVLLSNGQLTNQQASLAPANESEDIIISSQSYLSNCTSGGLVTIVTTANHLQDFEPIECDLVLGVANDDQPKRIPDNASQSNDKILLDVDITDQSSQTTTSAAVNQSETTATQNGNQSNCDKINRVIKANKIRPKSDSILISQCKDSSAKQCKNRINNNNKNNRNNNNKNNNNNINNMMNGFETTVKAKEKKASKKVQEQDGLPHQGWYHGSIGRVEAERLLENQSVGSYLVRVSESNSKDYSLSLKNQSGYLHIKIVHQPTNGYILGQFSQPFPTISSMIDHYKLNKLPIRGNENLRLVRPMIVEVL